MEQKSEFSSIPTYSVEQQNIQLQLQPLQEQQDQFMVEKFMNMCATIIQKFYRGHLMRKKHYYVVNQIQKFHDALWAVVLGWRIRKIIKLKRMQDLIQEMKASIWKRRELILSIRQNMPKIPKDYDSQFMRKKEKEALKVAMMTNQQYKFMSNELEPLQKEFLTTINRLMVTGLWIYEDKHYKKNVQTIVTSFTIIDQSKHVNKESVHPSTQFNRSQFVTPTQSQYLSPPGSNVQSKMVFATPVQQQQQHRVAFHPQQSQTAAPTNVPSQFNYPEAGNAQSIYQEQQNQQQEISKDSSTVQFGSARQVQLERKLNYNQQSQENILQSKKSFEQIEQKQAESELKMQNQQNQQQQSQNNIQNHDKPLNMKGAFQKQQCRDMDQDQSEAKNEENQLNQHNEQPQQQQQQQEKPQGFSWDDVPVGQARKKFQFDEYPENAIKTDIKPTIPKKKMQKLKEQNTQAENEKAQNSSRKTSEEITQHEEKKEAVKKSAKGKIQKKQQEEQHEEIASNSKSKQLPRSQTEFPLVYQGDLDTGTHKSKSKNSKVPLTQEEKEEKERQEKLEKIKNLKKRMKYDPRKAIQNEKNGVKDKKDEDDDNDEAEDNRINSEENDEDDDQVNSRDQIDNKNRSKSTHIPSKKDKENDRNNDKQTDKVNYLKRQSKNMASQKLNWKKTESRVDCWSSWNKRSKNYIQNSQTNFINNTPTKRKITLSSHNQQSARSNSNNEFSFAQNKLHSVSEAQQFQQKVRNKFGLNGQSNTNLPSEKNILSPQQSMTMIKQSNWLHSTIDPNQKDLMTGKQSGPSMGSFMKLPNLDLNSLQNISTGDLLKLREALIPIIQTNLIFIEQNDPKIFTKIAKEILKSSNTN
ncbi:hypothetical protein ABPG74_021121 [Tetrahymena malaccensis]